MRPHRLLAGPLAGALLGLLALPGGAAGRPPALPSLTAASDASPLALLGDGTEGARQSMNIWGNAVFGAPSPVNLEYFGQGTVRALQSYLGGNLDYFVSGLPPTPSEQSALTAASRSLIAIPLQADAMGFLLVSNPTQTGPAPALNPSTHATPVPSGTEINLNGGDSTYYLEQYFNTAQPAAWDSCLQASGYPAALVSESWPAGGTCQLVTAGAAGGAGSGAVTGVDGVLQAFAANADGCCAAVPPWSQMEAQTTVSSSNWGFAQIQNAAGDWVASTVATVQAAVVAGDGKPLSALTSPEPGAYPLSWMDDLYAPTSGLSVEKVDALATFIRYAVTSGSAPAASTGTVPLPAPLVPQALKGADDLVRDNCTGPGAALVSTTDPGPYAPNPHALDALGPRLMCEQLSTGGATGSPGPVAAVSPPPTPSPSTPAVRPTTTPVGRPTQPASAAPNLAQPSTLFPVALGPQTVAVAPSGTVPAPVEAAPPASGVAPVRLLYGLPFSGSGRTDTPVTFLIGALLPWVSYRGYRRHRRRKLGA